VAVRGLLKAVQQCFQLLKEYKVFVITVSIAATALLLIVLLLVSTDLAAHSK
jgi:hypothetical protein